MKTNQATKEAPADIQWDAVEGGNTEFSVQYPRMQWVHGEAKASGFMKSGGLFISEEQYPNFEAEGFQPDVLVTDDGTQIMGYAAPTAKLAILRVKHQWVKDEGRNVPLVQAIAVAKGCEDLLCISLRGATKALDFQKAFNQHMAHNVSLANRTRPQNAPAIEPFALWFPLTAGPPATITSKDGKNKSTVTPPALAQPEKLDRDYVVSLWVGSENYKRFASYYRDTAAWQKAAIWEQRNGDEAEFTGDERASDEQLHHIINLATAKGFDEAEVMQEISNGQLTKYDQLTRNEAREFLDKLKAM